MTKKDKSTDNLHKIVEIEKPKGVSKQPMSITQRRSVPSIRSIIGEQILTRIKEACLSPEEFANIRSSVRQRIVEVSPDDKEKGSVSSHQKIENLKQKKETTNIRIEELKKLAEEFCKDEGILREAKLNILDHLMMLKDQVEKLQLTNEIIIKKDNTEQDTSADAG